MTDEKLTQEQADDKVINEAFQELLDRYLASKHRKKVEIITRAFNFARQAHKGVRRRSGEPYILHPIAVARIACVEIGLGSTSICAALLHDVVEDTDYTVEDIENLFGPKIAQIVDGLTKISGGIFGDRASAQTENFKKLLLTMNDDIRVILIKMADRLHNMRTLGSMLPSKQYKIAGETLYIYAPLAYRLGLNRIKSELEDLSFKYEHPETYKQIQDKIQSTQAERDTLFEEFTAPIRKQLDKMGLPYRITARVKTPYSIWNKMQTKHITFEEIYDILAVRVIFTPRNEEEELNDCFNIYVAFSRIYKPHPDRLRDWVSHPKANGYQALHVTLMSNKGQWIEVQIRSERMDEVAEQGFAAHWKYKSGENVNDEGELSKWLKTIKEILDDPQPDALDFLDTIKLNLFASEIFVFTPKGDIKTMPQGSTALDFAFSIHTFLGSHCIGAKVNHKLVPLSHKLQSGDQVEVLTSKSQRVEPSWINYATTAKAKAKIQVILKREKKERIQQGEDIILDFFQRAGLEQTDEYIQRLCENHDVKNYDELAFQLGCRSFQLTDADLESLKEKPAQQMNWKKYIASAFGKKSDSKPKQEEKQDVKKLKIDKKKVLKLTPDAIMKNYIIADCCKPIPGDDVLGYIDDHNRIIIHKRQCPVASQLKTSFGNRLLAAQWETGKALNFPVNVFIKGIDTIGVLLRVTEVLSRELNVNIHRVSTESNTGIFEGRIQLLVHDVDDVNTVCTNLKKIDQIKKVIRIENFDDPIPD